MTRKRPQVQSLHRAPLRKFDKLTATKCVASRKKYVEKVTEEVKVTQKEQAGVLPDNPLYTAKGKICMA